jgi:L-rhamnose isomerase
MSTLSTIEAESQSLGTHVELCAQRYKSLDERLTNLESKIDRIDTKVDEFRVEMKKTLIITAGTIVTSVITTLGVILIKFL